MSDLLTPDEPISEVDLTPRQWLRLRCAEAAANSISGRSFAVPMEKVLDLAVGFETWVLSPVPEDPVADPPTTPQVDP